MGHFYPRQTIVAPVGLVTEPNEYGQYPPGALQVARNVTMREPGRLPAAPNVRDGHLLNDADGIIRKLMPADDGVVYAVVFDGGVSEIFADTVLQTTTPGGPDFDFSGCIFWAQCNDRLIVNEHRGGLVHDPTPRSVDFRALGMPQPAITLAGVNATDGWIEADQTVAYRACFVRRYENDYTLRSAPSAPLKVHNPTGGTPGNVDVWINWPSGAGLEEGDIIEIYRTDILATTSESADSGDTFKLVKEYVLSAADVVSPPAGFGLQIEDTQAPVTDTLTTPGRELYTNPGVEGENYANLRPPIADCVVSFKGFCFYLNTTERAKLVFSLPGGVGRLSVGAAPPEAPTVGIGARIGSGTITMGSPDITGVPADQMAGIVPGQLWSNASDYLGTFPANSTVVSAVGTTITMSANALVADGFWGLDDAIELGWDGSTQVYRFDSPNGLLASLSGIMEVQTDQPISSTAGYFLPSLEITLLKNLYPFHGTMNVRATNGQNYSPPLPEMDEDLKEIAPLVRKNRYVWSKEQQPEHVPSGSEDFAGFGEIYAANATRDAVWIWCSDGLFRLSGNGGSFGLGSWQLDYANATLRLCAPQASTVCEDRLYGHTNEGFVQVDSGGNVRKLTEGKVGNLIPGRRYRRMPGIIAEANEANNEVLLTLADADDFAFSNRVYIYNARENGWTYLDDNEEGLSNVSAIALFRLPPDFAEPHVLFAQYNEGLQPGYFSWIGGHEDTTFYLGGDIQYQPVYGDDPLELKRFMWADYLFAPGSITQIVPKWNLLTTGPVALHALDVSVYARAGCPRQVGLSHSMSPGCGWLGHDQQQRFEGLSLAIKQRTNQSKQR